MRMLDMLRAMDAFVGDQDDGGAILCHTCGAPVESDALARQTMADGALMWPEPFCAACLLAGLERLKAWLAAGGAGTLGEDGE